MPLIDVRGEEIADGWSYPVAAEPDAPPAPIVAGAIVPLDVLIPALAEGAVPRPVGVLLPSNATIDKVLPVLAEVGVVAVEFPKFRDGRGFTIARALREKHLFAGDIRAVGHFLPDQFAMLVQCGFTSFVTPAGHPTEQWKQPVIGNVTDHARHGQLLTRLVGRGVLPA